MSPTRYFWFSPPAALVTTHIVRCLARQPSHRLHTNHSLYAEQFTDSSSECYQVHCVTLVKAKHVSLALCQSVMLFLTVLVRPEALQASSAALSDQTQTCLHDPGLHFTALALRSCCNHTLALCSSSSRLAHIPVLLGKFGIEP
jgi:hypothetical protein